MDGELRQTLSPPGFFRQNILSQPWAKKLWHCGSRKKEQGKGGKLRWPIIKYKTLFLLNDLTRGQNLWKTTITLSLFNQPSGF